MTAPNGPIATSTLGGVRVWVVTEVLSGQVTKPHLSYRSTRKYIVSRLNYRLLQLEQTFVERALGSGRVRGEGTITVHYSGFARVVASSFPSCKE